MDYQKELSDKVYSETTNRFRDKNKPEIDFNKTAMETVFERSWISNFLDMNRNSRISSFSPFDPHFHEKITDCIPNPYIIKTLTFGNEFNPWSEPKTDQIHTIFQHKSDRSNFVSIKAALECGNCKKENPRYKCPCGLTYYCCKDCQVKNWEKHKLNFH